MDCRFGSNPVGHRTDKSREVGLCGAVQVLSPLGWKTRYSLKCQSSWRALASTATPIIERPARRDGERLRGKIAFPELPNGIDDPRLPNPTPCGIRKNKDQLFRSHNAESRTEHPAFAKQSSLVDETGIEPATSSLRTVGKISEGKAPQSLSYFHGPLIGKSGKPVFSLSF